MQQPQPWLDDDTAPDDSTPGTVAEPVVDEDGPDDIDEALPTIAPSEPARTYDALRAIEADVIAHDAAPASPEQALEARNLSLVEQANALQVTDPATFERAGEFLRVLADAEKRVRDFMDDDIARAHAAWKGLTEKRRAMLDPIEQAKSALGRRYAEFDRAEKARAEEARRKAEAEAQAAERARLEAEAAALMEQAQEAADPRQADRLAQEAAEVAQEAATVAAPFIPTRRTVAPAKGISSRSNWTAEVTDKMALIRAVAAGELSPEALDANMVYLRARAKADKQSFTAPGVRVYDAAGVSVRTR